MVSKAVGDVGDATDAQHADDQVPERGHGAGATTGADLRSVLIERAVTDPMKAILDGPVAADPGGQLGRFDLVGGEAGDCVHRLGSRPLRACGLDRATLARDLDGLPGMRKCDSGPDRDDLEGVLLDAAVRPVARCATGTPSTASP